MAAQAPSERTRVRRRPDRGRYDRETIHSILDEGLLAHVGFAEDEQPFVIPMVYGRIDDRLYLHGSSASRLLRRLDQGVAACVTVTLLDGLVVARSAFHHSMNFRSVVVMGRASPVTDAGERLDALRAIVDHVVPGRWGDTRGPTATELAQTLVLALPIDEASAKVREGPPADDASDLAGDHWAGVIPLHLTAGPVTDDPTLRAGIDVPQSIRRWTRGQSR